MNIEPEATEQITPLIEDLREQGFILVHAKYDAEHFGNCVVEFRKDDLSLRIFRDRSQWIIEGNSIELQNADLWRAFDCVDEFSNAVLTWIKR